MRREDRLEAGQVWGAVDLDAEGKAMNKSIDDHMAEDNGYRDEMDRLNDYYEKALAEAKTDEEREAIRRQAVRAYQGARYARYDRAKAKASRG
jgi:hypothetical protein